MPQALERWNRVIEQIQALRLRVGPPRRVLVGQQRLLQRWQEMLPLPAIEVGGAREQRAREKQERAELGACPDSRGNQVWMTDVATGDGLDVFPGATGQHLYMVGGRADRE